MDSLTQIVLGASVGEVALGKKVGNKAMLYGAIGGTIPDLDVYIGKFYDTVIALEIHRGFTHSILFSILFGLLFGWLISLWEKGATWKEWSKLMFLALFTHPLLDAHTTWGTQLFWPLDLRLAYKNIFVIDPLYTLPFMGFLLWAMFLKKDHAKRRRLNNIGLFVSSSYLVLTIILKGIVYTKFTEALDQQKLSYTQIETRPSPLNSILWTANVETDDHYLIGYYSFFDSKPIHFTAHPKNHHLLGALKDNDKIRRLIKITNGWYSIAEKDKLLYINDLRFGTLSVDPSSQNFVFSYLLTKSDHTIQITEVPKDRSNAKKLLNDLWLRIKGN
ncbi:metal-dependent hydrolase [Zhouia amylolytica]|uniref:metal-dependent hydrolase n=1 Tax=Zhouia amylolytica TaxID=376730 RepID=UPI0020CC3EF8|nr:metal-dependent hydrolase [Zhouia amylolytica]MCQ0112106.1 metal-dependent hydrolase [Zhouia amylolytica]